MAAVVAVKDHPGWPVAHDDRDVVLEQHRQAEAVNVEGSGLGQI
jgi:hypothetical protein